MSGQNQPPMTPINLSMDKIKEFESLECSCGNEEFIEVFKIKKLPVILSPTGQSGIVRMQFLRCVECGAEMNPMTGISKEKDGGKEQGKKED